MEAEDQGCISSWDLSTDGLFMGRSETERVFQMAGVVGKATLLIFARWWADETQRRHSRNPAKYKDESRFLEGKTYCLISHWDTETRQCQAVFTTLSWWEGSRPELGIPSSNPVSRVLWLLASILLFQDITSNCLQFIRVTHEVISEIV